MWILILTLATSEAPAIASVPGFSSETACEAAGVKWKAGAEATRRASQAFFMCVKPSP